MLYVLSHICTLCFDFYVYKCVNLGIGHETRNWPQEGRKVLRKGGEGNKTLVTGKQKKRLLGGRRQAGRQRERRENINETNCA